MCDGCKFSHITLRTFYYKCLVSETCHVVLTYCSFHLCRFSGVNSSMTASEAHHISVTLTQTSAKSLFTHSFRVTSALFFCPALIHSAKSALWQKQTPKRRHQVLIRVHQQPNINDLKMGCLPASSVGWLFQTSQKNHFKGV